MAWGGIGDAVLRKEDARLVTGAGRFGDDEDILGAASSFARRILTRAFFAWTPPEQEMFQG